MIRTKYNVNEIMAIKAINQMIDFLAERGLRNPAAFDAIDNLRGALTEIEIASATVNDYKVLGESK